MARISQDGFTDKSSDSNDNIININASGQSSIEVPSKDFISDAQMHREGQDLHLAAPNGDVVIINNYFITHPSPLIESSDGSILTPNLVNSFLNVSSQFSDSSPMTDEVPVGAIEELSGEAYVIRSDGTSETLTLQTLIFQGDVIETSNDGAVNIIFIDETSMAVSQNARLAIDEYEFDLSTESGATNLSILKGVFVFTSGLIGRDDPDDVQIHTTVGSIGIRGTIIAGNIQPGGESEITVMEGAIVVKNGAMETTLSQQYETVKLGNFNENMELIGVKKASDMGKSYGSISDVVPKLFSSINDTVKEETNQTLDKKDISNDATVEDSIQENNEIKAEESQNSDLQEDNLEINSESLMNRIQTKEINFNLEPAPIEKSLDEQPFLRDHVKEEDIQNPLFLKDRIESEPVFKFIPKQVFEHSEEGAVVAKVFIGNLPTGATFTLANNGGGLYELSNVTGNYAEITLTSTGSVASTSTLGSPLGAQIELIATLTDGKIITRPINPLIADAQVNLNLAGGLDYDVNSIGNLTPPQSIGDFDGDGINDFVIGTPTANTGNGEVRVLDGNTNSPISNLSGSGGNLGHALDGVGDINNDGFADVIASAPNTLNGTTYLIDKDTTSGNLGTTATIGENSGDRFGHAVSGIGDFDGDGNSDYAVSATGFDGGGLDRGRVYLKLDGSEIRVTGHVNNMFLGDKIEGLGDINGDGLSDVMMSTSGAIINEAYVVFGGTSNDLNTGSLGGNGFKILTGANEIMDIGFVGDTNGDGLNDFAVSLKMGSDINTFVIGGNASLPSVIDMTYLENPDNALKIHHKNAGSALDYNVSSAGDINGDGFDDVQVGITGGNQFVVHGNAQYSDTITDGAIGDAGAVETTPDGIIRASANNQSLAGDVDFHDNNNTSISMKGGSGNNIFTINNDQFKNIDGGFGQDTLNFEGLNLDLVTANTTLEQINGIEKLQLNSTSSTLTLSTDQIFNLLKSSDDGSLTIELGTSGSGTQLNIQNDSGVTISGTVTDDIRDMLDKNGDNAIDGDATYHGVINGNHHYEIGGYNLYIQDDANLTVATV